MSGDFDTPSTYDNTFAGKNVVNPPPCFSCPVVGHLVMLEEKTFLFSSSGE